MKILTVLLVAVMLLGCATETGNLSADRRGRLTNAILGEIGRAVGGVALSTLKNAATDQLNGRKVDFAHSASEGLWAGMGSIVTSDSVKRIIDAYGGGELPAVSATASQKVKEVEKLIGPLTQKEGSAVLSVIANAISYKAST